MTPETAAGHNVPPPPPLGPAPGTTAPNAGPPLVPPPPGASAGWMPVPISRTSMRETMTDASGKPAWAALDLFRQMRETAVDQLRNAMEGMYFQPGDTILHQGDTGSEMYILDRGAVRVIVRGKKQDTHFERVLTAPALFGEMALITQAPRTATVVAEDEVRVLRLSREGFDELVRRHPQVGDFLTRAVGERLLEAGSIQHVGKYTVAGRLGAGAVATVFEGINPELGRSVALKMLSHALVHHPGFRDQFQKEAQLIASLDHDHIVRVYDTERAWGTHFIVMEKLDGVTLDDLVQTGTRLAWGAIRRILREIASALAYSHTRGLLHRDIKPSNVFLTSEDRRVKLLDFGIAVTPETSEARRGDQLFGTPYYMSPEQILGQRLDGRSDLYSLGILAYELITMEVPFDADTIEELWRKHLYQQIPDVREKVVDVPEDLVEFIWRATAKRASDRFSSCAEAVQFLKTAAELPAVRSIELTTLAISYHPSRRHLVEAALEQLNAQLSGIEGIALLAAQQNSVRQPRE